MHSVGHIYVHKMLLIIKSISLNFEKYEKVRKREDALETLTHGRQPMNAPSIWMVTAHRCCSCALTTGKIPHRQLYLNYVGILGSRDLKAFGLGEVLSFPHQVMAGTLR